ncbi:MAG: hypothetical protein FJ405_11450 [Verrucomicrobia bacterium]|nr:hypothetical protein [Verrucomicrobiota bacterium]
MNDSTRIPRRGPKAAARRERILAQFKRSGLSAYAFVPWPGRKVETFSDTDGAQEAELNCDGIKGKGRRR